ncbi:MAG: carboxymuconolactone decarboxylase family protein [Novosphingobium sp.]|nr:carboxymuconolactone decarboxylase family protein [Novosphingobium sp.]
MTRIASLPVDQWDPELRELTHGEELPEVQQKMLGVYANAPEMAKPFLRFTGEMGAAFTLRRRLLELVRLRIAFHNQCRSCMAVRYESALADGLTEDMVCSLEKPYEAPDLTDADKSALRFADLFATNHLAITDEVLDDLRKHYTEKEVVELSMHCAYCVGFGRMAATYRIIEELPESFQDTTRKVAPWEQGHTEKLVIPV